MIEYVVACAGAAAAIYLLGFLVVARRAALDELGKRRSMYPQPDVGEYAGAGIWGLLIGTFWPVLAVAIVFGAGVGWLLTRSTKTNGGGA